MWSLGLVALVVAQTSTASATDDVRAREAEMFGAPADVRAPEAETFGAPDDTMAREAEMFGAPPTTTATRAPSRRRREVLPSDLRSTRSDGDGMLRQMTDRIAELDRSLTLGGTMWLQLQGSWAEDGGLDEAALSSPNIVDVFVDARPNDRLRAFVQGRLTYDPTTPQQSDGAFGAGGPTSQVQLDQLWLRFDIYRRAFVTAGAQRVRWGSGRLWNPTDFLNQQRLNPIALFDIRLGVPLVKVHVPIESWGWNFYAVANLDQASEVDQVQGALRGEMLIVYSELSLSAAARNGAGERLGADLTFPLWDLDLRVEAAVLHGDPTPRVGPLSFVPGDPGAPQVVIPTASRIDDWIPQLVAGAELAVRYSDEDSVILGAEYFFNDAGYSNEAVYLPLLLDGRFNPLDVGRHYVGAYISLIGPGSWNDTSLFMSGIANLSDLSGFVRTDLSFQLLTFLSWRLFTNVFWGEGAFSPSLDFDPRLLQVATDAGFDPTGAPTLAIPVFQLGTALRLDL